MRPSKQILVVGATGRLGAPVATHLASAGYSVRALVRDSSRAKGQFGDSVEVVDGDATNLASFRQALDGCDGLHLSVSGSSEGSAVANAAQLATDLELSRITYISGAATFPENDRFAVVRTKLECERLIAECGAPYTILCPSFAMEVLPMHVQDGRASYFGKQPYPFHWLAADDLAASVCAAYESAEAVNRRFFVWGPEPIMIGEALRTYCDVAHPQIKKVSSLPFWMAKALAAVLRNQPMKTAIEVYQMFEGVGGDGGDPEEGNRVLGKPETTLAAWVDFHKAKGTAVR